LLAGSSRKVNWMPSIGSLTTGAARRGMAQTVPRLGTPAQMEAEALQQIRARIAYQKEIMASKHGVEEEVKEMWRWVNISFYVALPIIVASCLYSFLMDEHGHREEGPLPEYMGIRNKEFPWQCDQCDLFDLKCWKKCKAEKNK
jgi:cytochrome c oxidase subunit 6a